MSTDGQATQANAIQADAIPELDFLPADLTTLEQSHEAYAELRKCPVHHSNAMGGFYWLNRYQDVRDAALEGDKFSSALKGVMLPPDVEGARLFALEEEGADHSASRRIYAEAMTPTRIKQFEPILTDMINSLIDKFAKRGECDLVQDFAGPLPVLAVCALLGVSGLSVDRIRDLSSHFGDDAATRKSVIDQLGSLVLDEVLERRKNPQDDYLTRIATVEFNGKQMDDDELKRFMSGFLTAGHETTTSSLASMLQYLLLNQNLKARVMTDSRALVSAVEEAIRLKPPFHAFHRTTTRAVDVGGKNIPADATVRLCFASANRDPDVYENPDEFNVDRKGPPHLGFGFGRHMCVGAPLARAEMRAAVRLLLERLPDITLAPDAVDYRFMGGLVFGPCRLNAVFTPACARKVNFALGI